MANVTLTLDPEVLEDVRALAREKGVSVSAWVAAKVRKDMRARNLAAYRAWQLSAEVPPESAAFDRASEEATAASWAGSEW